MKNTLFLFLVAGLTACQPASPQATSSPRPSPTVSASIAEPVPSISPSLPPEPVPSASPSSDFAQSFNLKYQSPLRLNRADLELTFTELTQDSRCPSDVTCVWAGEVAVKVQLKQASQPLGIADLTLGADPAKASVKLGDYQLTLLEVSPYPESTQTRQPQDYQLKIQIEVPLDLTRNKSQKTLE